MLSLVLAALFFAGIHLGIAGTAMRDRAIGILGENGYRGAFAAASIIGLGWLVAARDLGHRGCRWHCIDRCKASAALGSRLGAICSADLDCSVRSHRRRAE